jgi:RNA polymerase primary sigma factor
MAFEDEKPTAQSDDNGDYEDRSLDSLRMYLKEIKRTKLLTADEERELAFYVRRGDSEARKRMIESNLRLVVKIAKRYGGQGLPLVDLIEEGNIGLIKAVEKFDPGKNCRFSTYATLWIRQSIERGLVNQTRTVKIPAHVASDMKRIVRVTRALNQALGREPTVEEVAEEMGVSMEYVQRLVTAVQRVISIEAPLDDEDAYHLTDLLKEEVRPEPLSVIESLELFKLISSWMDLLSYQEKLVIDLRFGLRDGEPRTLESIGEQFGVTRERIRQVEVKALQRLRKVMEEKDVLLLEDVQQ